MTKRNNNKLNLILALLIDVTIMVLLVTMFLVKGKGTARIIRIIIVILCTVATQFNTELINFVKERKSKNKKRENEKLDG